MNTHSKTHATTSSVEGNQQKTVCKTLPVLLEEIQEIALSQLMLGYKKAFDLVDNSFFNRAEKASNNNEQSLYFDAMRKLRLNRHLAEKSFEIGLLNNFKTFPYLSEKSEHIKFSSGAELTLVQHDDLEENIAFDAMTSKAHADNIEQLYHLGMRLDALVADAHVDENNTVLSPTRIVDILMLSVSALDLEIQCKLILYKQFDLTVMAALGSVIRQSNRLLIDAGVLPDLRYKVSKSNDELNKVKELTDALVSNLTELSELTPVPFETSFSELQSLLTQARSRGYAAPRSALTGTFIPPEEMFAVLNALQTRFSQQYASDASLDEWLASNVNVIKPSSLRLSILEALALRGDTQAKALDQENEDVINLVEMLFELILDDNYLPSTIQALISRLQIPIVKIALKDKDFFNRPNHPARKLLNALTKACVGWSSAQDNGKDDLLKRIYDIVQQILNAENIDAHLFESLYEEFHHYIEKEGKRVRMAERRTREYEVGVAKVKFVKDFVAKSLSQCIGDKAIPQVVHELLYQGWSKVLYSIYLNEGPDSLKWADALQAANDLVWSVQTHNDVSSQGKCVQLLPQLLKSLHEGLAEISYDPFEINALFSRLEKVHITAFKAGQLFEPNQSSSSAENANQTDSVPLNDPADDIALFVKQTRQAVNPTSPSSDTHGESMAVLDKETQWMLHELGQTGEFNAEPLTPMMTDIDEATTNLEPPLDVSGSQADHNETIDLSEGYDQLADMDGKTGIERQKIKSQNLAVEYQEKVMALNTETWFVFNEESGNELRCKLIEKINETREMVFVNRRGQKVFVKTFNCVADELRKGEAQIVELSTSSESSLFDRAFSRLLGLLNSEQKQRKVVESSDDASS